MGRKVAAKTDVVVVDVIPLMPDEEEVLVEDVCCVDEMDWTPDPILETIAEFACVVCGWLWICC